MKFNYTDTLFALSHALDCVEQEFNGATIGHGKRIACITVKLGQALGLDSSRQMDLAACAILHDCGLLEYVQEEYHGSVREASAGNEKRSFEKHCIYGEKQMEGIPFYYPKECKGAILCHHETADGSGPFGKTTTKTPLYARLIHFAEELDTRFHLEKNDAEDFLAINAFLDQTTDQLCDSLIVSCFRKAFSQKQLAQLSTEQLDHTLSGLFPTGERELTPLQLMQFAGIFAAITDYKATSTRKHSTEIARLAKHLGEYYGANEELSAKLYFAGALHDIGKLSINVELLEKPDKLTRNEYRQMQQHAYQTFLILRRIPGLEDITRWASYHHERLDGSGYPFHLTAMDLDHWSRMIACLDIYQALIEDRPYKEGMPHDKACGILQAMAENGQLDSAIVQDISQVFAPVELKTAI